MRCFVTGGTGFIGGALVKKLLDEGHHVRTLVRHGSDARQLNGLPIEQIAGDLSDIESLLRGTQGCEWVFHLAALYAFWGHTWEDFYQTNVEGTRNVLKAALQCGAQRIVHTSSIATLGHHPDRTPANEDTPVSLENMIGSYKRSKYMAEGLARRFADEGAPVVIVNPAAPVGVGDHKPTRTGKMIVDFLKGRMPAYTDTGLNIVDVEDVALGHLLAAQHGKIGQRYILGGENLTLKQVLDILAEESDRPEIRLRIPYGVVLAWGYLDAGLSHLIPDRQPQATPETARLSRQYEYFDSCKAQRELGYPQSDARLALRKSVQWYRNHGYVG